MIIVNSSLTYRKDVRSDEKMLENINRGMLVEQTIISLIIESVLKELPDVEVVKTDQNTVDTAPDLVLLRGDKRVNIEVQTLKGFYNGYADIGLCFHIKSHKMKHLNNGLSYICQDTGSGSRLGVYFLEPSKITGLIERPIQIFGNKPGYIVPVKNNLIPGNNLDSTIPSIVAYLKD